MAYGNQPCPNPNTQNKGLCARCHGPVVQVNVNENGKRYFQLPMYKLKVIGTDPMDAVNFNGRQVYTGVLKPNFGGKDKVGIGEALLVTTSEIMARELDHQHIPLRTASPRLPDFGRMISAPRWLTPQDL